MAASVLEKRRKDRERHKKAGALRGPILLSNTGSVTSEKLDDSDRECVCVNARVVGAKGVLCFDEKTGSLCNSI